MGFLRWCVAFASSHEGDEGGKGTRGGTKEGDEGHEGEVSDGSVLRDRCVGTGRRVHCSGLFAQCAVACRRLLGIPQLPNCDLEFGPWCICPGCASVGPHALP